MIQLRWYAKKRDNHPMMNMNSPTYREYDEPVLQFREVIETTKDGESLVTTNWQTIPTVYEDKP